MLSIGNMSREDTLPERLRKAHAARTEAEQAVNDVEASLRAVKVDGDDPDTARALRAAIEERQRLQQELAKRRDAFDLASALVDDLEQLLYDRTVTARQREAVEVLGKQAETEALLRTLAGRLKELDQERQEVEDRLRATRAVVPQLTSRLSDLQRGGLVASQIGFTGTSRDEVPRKHPMRVGEWQRLWDGAHVVLGLNAVDCTVNRDTGRIVRFAELREVPGFELVETADYFEVVR